MSDHLVVVAGERDHGHRRRGRGEGDAAADPPAAVRRVAVRARSVVAAPVELLVEPGRRRSVGDGAGDQVAERVVEVVSG